MGGGEQDEGRGGEGRATISSGVVAGNDDDVVDIAKARTRNARTKF